MAKKNFYVVKVGRECGIYNSWEDTQQQISGFPGAIFKGFVTRKEAEDYLKEDQKTANGDRPAKGELYAYVDGSYDAATGRYAYGIVLLNETEEYHLNGVGENPEAASMRNVAGELSGAMRAMKYALEHGFSKLVIFHDYEGIAKWANDEWKTNQDCTQKYKLYCLGVQGKLNLSFQKVAAHTGNYYNELADELAKQALGIKK